MRFLLPNMNTLTPTLSQQGEGDELSLPPSLEGRHRFFTPLLGERVPGGRVRGRAQGAT
jgi:hypothetical protein